MIDIRRALARIEQRQKLIMKMLGNMAQQETKLMAKVEDVVQAVTDEQSVEQSAIVLLDHLTQMIKDAGTDPAKLDALVAQINSQKQTLADAVAADTPAE